MQYHLLQGNTICKTFLETNDKEIIFSFYIYFMSFKQDIKIII